MKAAVWHGKRDIRIERLADPQEGGPGQALIKVALTGICGTDLHEYTDGPQYIPSKPDPQTGEQTTQTLGHEMTGTVVETGDGVTRAKKGDRVAIFAIRGCGHCRMCRLNVPAICT